MNLFPFSHISILMTGLINPSKGFYCSSTSVSIFVTLYNIDIHILDITHSKIFQKYVYILLCIHCSHLYYIYYFGYTALS